MKKKILEKLKCRKGSGEILGFIAALPVYIFALLLFVGFIQIGIAAQTLEQATYTAARIAVLQNNLLLAEQAAEFAADAAISSASIAPITTEVNLTLLAGGNPGGSARWEHGSLLQTEVVISFTAIGIRRDVNMSSELVMMVERPLPIFDQP